MSGKKAAKGKKGGKKKKSGSDDGPDLDVEMKLQRANLRIEALERELVIRADQAHRAVESKNELRQRVLEYHRDFEKEKQERLDITADMTRQYKAMQEELIRRINQLETTSSDLRQQLELAHIALRELRAEKDSVIIAKEHTIAEQKLKMEEMAVEFGEMLKETLDKMTQRIEMANADWDPNADGGADLANRLKEFKLDHIDVS